MAIKQRGKPSWKKQMLSFLYDSGADGHYLTEATQKAAGLAILGELTKQVIVVEGTISKGVHQVRLPFKRLSPKVNEADTFKQFNNSLLSVGMVKDNGNISIFTSDGVTPFTKKKMSSSLAKANQYWLEYETNQVDINPTGPKTQHLETLQAFKAGSKGLATSEQRLQPTFYRRMHQTDAYSMRLPSQEHSDQGN